MSPSYADILRGGGTVALDERGSKSKGKVLHEEQKRSNPKSIYEATSVGDIKATLAELHDKEVSVTARLDELLASQRDLSRELGKLDLMRGHLGTQAVATRDISNGILSEASSLAGRISKAVKRLDLEQSRVKATLDVVEQVSELKTCVLGVTGSMGAPQDWETAASYLNRASNIPREVVEGEFAAEIVPTAEVPDPPADTLETAAESLCGLFLREFEKAAKENNGAKVTRFFKLFPLIGKSDIGLDVYGRYVCEGVSSRARAYLDAGVGAGQRKEQFFYANALTKLFEQIAQIVDGHGNLVERHYGVGKMVNVIERLQAEADLQGGIIIDTWADERRVERRLTDIRSYAFSFLVQSFLPPQRSNTNASSRGVSPANRDAGDGRRASEDESVDMKEIDALLNEMAVMLGRWELYARFLADKCTVTNNKDENTKSPAPIPEFLLQSNLNRKISDRVIQAFNTMTTFFFRRSVEKAFQLDEPAAGLSLNPHKALASNPPYVTSSVDDVMYIVKKLLQQCVATSSKQVIAAVVPTIARVLNSDFIGMIQRKMRDECYPKAPIQGALPPEHLVITFLVLINNLDIATEYLTRIIDSYLSPITPQTSAEASAMPLLDVFPDPKDHKFVLDTLRHLPQTFTHKASELLNDGVHVTFNQVLKPRLRPLLAESFRDMDYLSSTPGQQAPMSLSGTTDDETDGTTDPNSVPDLVSSRFSDGWERLMVPLLRILTPSNADRLVTLTSSYLAYVLEKRIWSYHGRVGELGAVRLERDIEGLVGVVVKGRKYGLRERFERCRAVCRIMNMEDDEWDELSKDEDADADVDVDGHREEWGGLGADEVERARGMVVRDTKE